MNGNGAPTEEGDSPWDVGTNRRQQVQPKVPLPYVGTPTSRAFRSLPCGPQVSMGGPLTPHASGLTTPRWAPSGAGPASTPGPPRLSQPVLGHPWSLSSGHPALGRPWSRSATSDLTTSLTTSCQGPGWRLLQSPPGQPRESGHVSCQGKCVRGRTPPRPPTGPSPGPPGPGSLGFLMTRTVGCPLANPHPRLRSSCPCPSRRGPGPDGSPRRAGRASAGLQQLPGHSGHGLEPWQELAPWGSPHLPDAGGTPVLAGGLATSSHRLPRQERSMEQAASALGPSPRRGLRGRDLARPGPGRSLAEVVAPQLLEPGGKAPVWAS